MIPVAKPHIGNQELMELGKVLASGCAAGTCPEVELFEREFAEYVGSKYAVATNSCTSALHIACLLLKANEFKRTAVPAYTFPATGSAPMYCNAPISLVDVDPGTWNMRPDALSMKHKIAIPVHSFGNPCNMPEIMDNAHDRGISVIEDAACAVATTLNKKHTGTFGEIGCYSMYGIKEICTGEGGMLVTDNEEHYELAKSLVDFGKTSSMPLPKFEHLGYNYRLSAIQAAIGRVQLAKLDTMHSKRKAIAKMYNSVIDSELGGNAIRQECIHGAVHSYQRYAVLLSIKFDRNQIMEEMRVRGIQTSIGTFDLASIPLYGDGDIRPISKRLFNQSISLPMYPDLSMTDAESVIDNFVDVLKQME